MPNTAMLKCCWLPLPALRSLRCTIVRDITRRPNRVFEVRLLSGLSEQPLHLHRAIRFGIARQRGGNDQCLVVVFEPDEERRLFGSGKALLIDPHIKSSHIRVDQRSYWIEFRILFLSREQFVHGALPLARRKSRQNRQRLSAPPKLPRRPLHESRAEDLRR